MSNHLTCPSCRRLGSDSSFPANGFGNFVSQHELDRLTGAEDPAVVIQAGEKLYVCPACDRAIFRFGRGWYALLSVVG